MKNYRRSFCQFLVPFLLVFTLISCSRDRSAIYDSPHLQILFLGHNSEHHNSEMYMPMLASALVKKGIHFTYTANPNDLNEENLSKYDGLAIYANHEEMTGSQELALLKYVKSGKGFIPIHCASFCFQNSVQYIDLVGGQFNEHDTATFTAKLTSEGREMFKGMDEFETWDETYVHHKLNPSNTILMERSDGEHKEPWTWINNYGKGRIFYTAYGHDERTWSNKGFHDLMEKGILWAVGEEASKKVMNETFPNPEYTDATIPNYEKRDPPLKLQAALSPEESMKLTQIPVGFELELFAAEPDIINPIFMSWDERGRLWVIETIDYPNTVRSEDGVGDDQIKICEDTDGDGKADKYTVFADRLNIPTSMVFTNGGIIVSQAPHFLFLEDTDGDDKADVREQAMTGWGTFDTHAGPSNLRYGFNNKIWGTVGYSGFSGYADGNPVTFKQGIFSFNPDGSGLEQLSKTSNNTWGLGFSENFDVFASTANNTHSVFMGIPNSYLKGIEGLPQNGSKKIDGHYAFHPITEEVRQVDVFGGFTAAAGHNLYTARSFPEMYWNKVAFVCEPTGRLVHNAILNDSGSGFTEQDGWNLTASNDNWYGPVQAEVGPDGAVWIADWYNFIIQHNPTPPGFENGAGNAHINPLRDRNHGRIYRLKYKGANGYEPISLSVTDPAGLIEALKNDNLFWRMTAQRLLVERNKMDVVPALLELINSRWVDQLGINPAAIHALWTLHGLGVLTDQMPRNISKAIVAALNHPSAGVRKAAVQVLPKTHWVIHAMLASGILQDNNQHTQLAAILESSKMPPSTKLGEVLFNLSLENDIMKDEWLSQAVYLSAVQHQTGYLREMRSDNRLIDDFKQKLAVAPPDPWMIELDESEWKSIDLPGFWEETEIGRIDGTIWFRKEIQLAAGQHKKAATLLLGAIDDSDETWVNGIKVGGYTAEPRLERKYQIAPGILKTGKNVIAVKVIDTGGDGGFSAKPGQMRLVGNGISQILSGKWIYKIESIKGNSSKPLFDKDNTIAEVFLKNYYDPDKVDEIDHTASDWPTNAKVIIVKTIVNEMKYDISSFEVEAGQAVEIRFVNNDFMQHNLLILDQGSLKLVGAAADILATASNGAEKNYVPDIPQVLHATKLVDPNTEATIRFIAPEKSGEYPFVCTFPGHWQIMNGIMNVIPATNL